MHTYITYVHKPCYAFTYTWASVRCQKTKQNGKIGKVLGSRGDPNPVLVKMLLHGQKMVLSSN